MKEQSWGTSSAFSQECADNTGLQAGELLRKQLGIRVPWEFSPCCCDKNTLLKISGEESLYLGYTSTSQIITERCQARNSERRLSRNHKENCSSKLWKWSCNLIFSKLLHVMDNYLGRVYLSVFFNILYALFDVYVYE